MTIASTRTRHPQRQHGGGTLIVLMALLLASALMLLYLNRALIFEQRSAANQWRATRAFEATEAGRHWLVAQLNRGDAIDGRCAAPAGSASSAGPVRRLRTLMLQTDAATGRLQPTSASPACTWSGSSWQCGCPDSGAGTPGVAATAELPETPMFFIRLVATAEPGQVLARITGCSHQDGCREARVDAIARTEMRFATLPLLPELPAATLTAGGDISVAGTARVINADPRSGATTLDTGGNLHLGSDVQLLGPPGSLGGLASSVSGDAQFRSADGRPLDDAAQFTRTFGLDRDRFAALPLPTRLDCASGCAEAQVTAALASGTRVLWLAGDLHISQRADWGSADAPLLLIVDGTVQIDAALHFTGLLHARQLIWQHSGTEPGELRGAIQTTGPISASGLLDLRFEPRVLERLALDTGLLLPVPGSWRDFDL